MTGSMLDIPTIMNDPPRAVRQFLFQLIRNDWTRIQCYAKGVEMEWEEINWVLEEGLVSSEKPLEDYKRMEVCGADVVLALRLPLTETFVPTTPQGPQDPLSLDDYLCHSGIPKRYHEDLRGTTEISDFRTATKGFLRIINSTDDLYDRTYMANVFLLLCGFVPWLPSCAAIDDNLKSEPLSAKTFRATYQSYLDYMLDAVSSSWRPEQTEEKETTNA